MACDARTDLPQNPAAYQAQFLMEVNGVSVTLHRKTDKVMETLSGNIANNMLDLRGIGMRISSPSIMWELRIKGEFPIGATVFSGKGNMLVSGKAIRACDLTMIRG